MENCGDKAMLAKRLGIPQIYLESIPEELEGSQNGKDYISKGLSDQDMMEDSNGSISTASSSKRKEFVLDFLNCIVEKHIGIKKRELEATTTNNMKEHIRHVALQK